MAPDASSSSSASGRPAYACNRCTDRKVKCDKQRPCSSCVRHGAECVFSASRPPPKRHRRAQEKVLTDRLRYYEALLQERGVDTRNLPEVSTSAPTQSPGSIVAFVPEEFSQSTPSTVSASSRCVSYTQLVHSSQDRTKFVDNSLWTRVVEEFHDPKDALETTSSADASDHDLADDDCGFVLEHPRKSSSAPRHPPPKRILQLWNIFVENVEPLTKILHVPTLQPAIQKAINDTSAIPRNFEALMFAIYGAAIMSLNDEDCRNELGEPRSKLLSRYTAATKVALSRANFMGTISLVVLQALVLHLLSVRDIYEPRVVWTLTGVALRIAQSMGIERDGVSLGLPPFEVELRRRLWWLLKSHDFRTAELVGLAKFRDIDMSGESTKWPTNINDDQLYPSMSSPPAPSETLTDMVFVALRYELAKFAALRMARFRERGKNSSEWIHQVSGIDRLEIDEASKKIEETIETKYVRYCDPSNPLHLMTMLVARSAINNIRFLTHHPRRWASVDETPEAERQMVWDSCIKILEHHNMVQSNPMLKQFAWHATYFLQWHAFIHVLDTVQANPSTADARKAWKLIGSTYENNPDMILDWRKPIHVAVGNLCLRAYKTYEASLLNRAGNPSTTPNYIERLRQQSEAAMAKMQVRDAKRSERANPNSLRTSDLRPTRLDSDPTSDNANELSENAHVQENPAMAPAALVQPDGSGADASFWLANGFDDDQIANFEFTAGMPLDFTYDQDHIMEDITQSVTWDQWDAWLADSNVIGPFQQVQRQVHD